MNVKSHQVNHQITIPNHNHHTHYTITHPLQAYRDFFVDIGFTDNLNALSVIWEEVCCNLRNWCDNETVVNESLKLLLDVTNGYEFSKLLLQLPSVTFVLQNHTVHFSRQLHP